MRLALVQLQPEFRGRERNWARMREAVAATEADVVLFPELASCGYMYKSLEEMDGFTDTVASLQPLARTARESGQLIVGGFAERSGGSLYNSAFVITPESVEVYRKIHLWNFETVIFQRGETPMVVEFGGHRIGVEVCYDLQFPELGAYYARHAVELLLVPMAWPAEKVPLPDGLEPFSHLAIATAYAHGMFVAVSNRTGLEREVRFPGESSITDPLGRQRRLGSNEATLEENLDFELVLRAKHPSPFNDLDADARLSVEPPGAAPSPPSR